MESTEQIEGTVTISLQDYNKLAKKATLVDAYIRWGSDYRRWMDKLLTNFYGPPTKAGQRRIREYHRENPSPPIPE